jgi:hypothetical protein
MFPKPGKDMKFPQHLHPVSLLSTTGKLFEKVILKVVQRHIKEKCVIFGLTMVTDAPVPIFTKHALSPILP